MRQPTIARSRLGHCRHDVIGGPLPVFAVKGVSHTSAENVPVK